VPNVCLSEPDREDGRQIVGRVIYAFPLREAQSQGYFATIDYFPVVEFDNPDGAIASKAIEVLQGDLSEGRDHLLMARVRRIGRAREMRDLYAELAPQLQPVVLHSSLTATERREALAAIESRQSRIIVCVDMLGEGFDLITKATAVCTSRRSASQASRRTRDQCQGQPHHSVANGFRWRTSRVGPRQSMSVGLTASRCC